MPGTNKQTIIRNTGGGSGNDKGYFADITALNTAYPAGSDGWYAVLGSTDTIWIWDSGTSAWVDSGDGGSGSGDVAGPASATDNAIARFDTTTGKLIQNSAATIDDSGNITATNLSGTNTGNQTSIVGITGTKAQFDTAVTDGNILYVGDITQYTDEMAQDATGAMIDTSLVYTDGTPLLQRAALTGAITASVGSNATALGSFTTAQLNTALSDNDIATGGGTASGSNTGDNAANTTYASDYRAANFVAGTNYVAPNAAITGATKTKITYDAKGLVTAGADATTADIAASTNKNYVTDAQLTVIGNTSGTNSGNQTSIVGITGTLAQFNTAVTDAELARTDAANTFTGVQTFSTPIAAGSVATMTATVGGGVPTPPNNTTTFLRGDGSFATPAVGLKLPTYTVGASGADYTTIQGAIDAATTGGTIYVIDGTYTQTSTLLFKYNNTRIVGNGMSTKIVGDGSTVTTLVGFNTSNIKGCSLENLYFENTNVSALGVGLNFSNTPLNKYKDLYFFNFNTAIKANDTANYTFYNHLTNINIFECNNGFDFTSTNPINNNWFENIRIALKAGGAGKGLYMNNAQGNTFTNLNAEPGTGAGITGIHLDTNLVINTVFINPYLENNNVGVNISSSQRTMFIGGMIVANTTNVTDTGLDTAFLNTNVNYVLYQQMVNMEFYDKSNASRIAGRFRNNTSFAHNSSNLIEMELLNGSDTSNILQLKNAGSGKYITALSGSTELFSVDTSGSSSTMLSQVQNIINKNTTLNAGYSAYIPGFLEIANTYTLTVSNTSYLQVG